jgi:hypothetical protein
VAEPTPTEPPIWTEYGRHVWRYWWLVVVGGVGGVLSLVSLVASIVIPTWLGVVVLLVGLSVAQFLAFKEMRHHRNEARDALRKASAPLRGTVFKGQTLRLADIGRDLTDGNAKALINARHFEECKIVGPGFMMMLGRGEGAITHCTWDNKPDVLFIGIPEDRREVLGVVAFLECVFERCRFENVGVVGPPSFEAKFRAGMAYED